MVFRSNDITGVSFISYLFVLVTFWQVAMSKSDRQKIPNVLRWMDYVQVLIRYNPSCILVAFSYRGIYCGFYLSHFGILLSTMLIYGEIILINSYLSMFTE